MVWQRLTVGDKQLVSWIEVREYVSARAMDSTYWVAISIILILAGFGLKPLFGLIWGLIWKLIIRFTGLRPSSTPRKANPPDGIIEVNPSVWELHAPRGITEVVIIFFHGLQLGEFEDAFWKTWLAKDHRETVWPREWLGNRFPNARILSVTYNSCAMKSDGQLDMYTLGENLVSDIVPLGQDCPVFLVGHSLGGLVIKQFILSAIRISNGPDSDRVREIKQFIKNFKGVYYYATPHGGTEIANLASKLPNTSPILILLKTLSKDTRRINEEFRQQRAKGNTKAFATAEGRQTTFKGFNRKVVQEGSSRDDIDEYYTDQNSNHFEVCRAESPNGGLMQRLVRAIVGSLQNEKLTQAPDTIENLVNMR